jgi:PPE-repeat protein
MIPAFMFFPPEINSALISAGPGSGPLFAAASAWDALAAELGDSAASFQTTVMDLASVAWTGPSSTLMTAAAAPYVEWLVLAAGQAEVAALQARLAAAAYEGAVVATVPLPAVLANRARLLVLIATNFLGINTAAIAQTELEYVEMWAQDVAAMAGYHVGAQLVTQTLPSFSAAPAALGGGGGGAGLAGLASLVTTPLAGLLSQFLQALSSAGFTFASQLQSVLGALSPLTSLISTPVATLTTVAQVGMYPATALMSPMMAAAQGAAQGSPMLVGATTPPVDPTPIAGSTVYELQQPASPAGLGTFGVASAGLGTARLVGVMSVPAVWQGSMPAYIAAPTMTVLGGGAMSAAPVTAAASGPNSGVPVTAMPVQDKSPAGENRATRAEVVRSRPKVVPRGRPG